MLSYLHSVWTESIGKCIYSDFTPNPTNAAVLFFFLKVINMIHNLSQRIHVPVRIPVFFFFLRKQNTTFLDIYELYRYHLKTSTPRQTMSLRLGVISENEKQ